MGDDPPAGSNHERLRNRVAAVHDHHRRLAVCPAHAPAEIIIAHELPDAISRCVRIFRREGNKLDVPVGIFFANLFVIRHFLAARSAPRRPEIDNNDLVVIISKAQASAAEQLKRAIKKTLRQNEQRLGRCSPVTTHRFGGRLDNHGFRWWWRWWRFNFSARLRRRRARQKE